MGDGSLVFRKNRKVIASEVDPTVARWIHDVTKNAPVAQEIDGLQPLNWRQTVASDDLLKLKYRLTGVKSQRNEPVSKSGMSGGG